MFELRDTRTATACLTCMLRSHVRCCLSLLIFVFFPSPYTLALSGSFKLRSGGGPGVPDGASGDGFLSTSKLLSQPTAVDITSPASRISGQGRLQQMNRARAR